jgi:hypothetical protein
MPPALSQDAGRGDPDGQEQTEGVDPDVTLATCDFFAGVDALAGRGHVGRGLDALGVEHAGGWFAVAAFGLLDRAPQQAIELVEDAFLLPCGEVAVDRFPRSEVVGQIAPGDAGAVDVEDGVHDAAQVVLGWAADVQAFASALGPPGGERWSDQFPAGVGQVAGIRALSRHVSVVPSGAAPPQGANGGNRGRLGGKRERTHRNGPGRGDFSPIVPAKRYRLSRLRPARPRGATKQPCRDKTLFKESVTARPSSART